jgi:hypothetical protein
VAFFLFLTPPVYQRFGLLPMPFEYRFRFHLLPEDRITSAEPRLQLPGTGGHLRLQGWTRDAPIDQSPRVVLVGGSFKTLEAAREDGQRARRAVLLWALQRRLAVDLGDGRRRGGLTQAGAEHFAKQLGGPVRDQLHGLDVYEQFENQRFLGVEVNPGLRIGAKATIESIASWYDVNLALTEKQDLAAELYCSAHFDAPFRSRFLTLMTALEALLDHRPRSDKVRTVVAALEAAVEVSQLDRGEKHSLFGSLKWLHQESIGQAGRRVAATLLPTGTYAGLDAAKYFRKCYDCG